MSRYFVDTGFADRRRITNTRLLALTAGAIVKAIDEAFEGVQADIDAVSGGVDNGPLVFEYGASSSWIINHNLGRDVSIEVLSLGGARIGAEVLQVSLNQARVYFDVPIPGKVLIR